MTILGIDVGGTFTDAVFLAYGELRTAKVPTVRAQEHSVVKAAAEVGATDVPLGRFTHGTTIATNALLERKGARTAFVGTAGPPPGPEPCPGSLSINRDLPTPFTCACGGAATRDGAVWGTDVYTDEWGPYKGTTPPPMMNEGEKEGAP